MNTRKFTSAYTREACEKEIAWFEERMNQLPDSLQINDACYSPNLRLTVANLIRTVRANKPTVIFAGYMETLLQVKDRLLEQGMK